MSGTPQWAAAYLECRRQFRLFTREAIERQRGVPRELLPDTTDDLTFLLTWPAWYLLTKDRLAFDFMMKMRDGWRRIPAGDFHHGFYKEGAEAHHHTENYTRFLNKLYQIEPRDPVNHQINLDAAEHFGNFVEGIPEWYDWEQLRFLGVQHFGTITRDIKPGYRRGSLGNCRFIVMVIEAYLMSGETRFLDLATDYLDAWCDLHETIPQGERLPLRRYPSPEDHRLELSKPPPTPVQTMANCGYLGCLMDLYAITGRDRYVRMVQRVLGEAVDSPHAFWLWGAYAKYRAITFDTAFDAPLVERLSRVPRELPTRVVKVGRLQDWGLRWVYGDGYTDDGSAASPSALMAFAYAVTGKEAWAAEALAQVARRLELVRPLQDEGRFHGCEWGNLNTVLWWDVAGAFLPLSGVWGSTNPDTGHMLPTIRLESGDGRELPATVAALVRQTAKHQFYVQLANAGPADADVRVIPSPDHYREPVAWEARVAGGEARRVADEEAIALTLRPEQTVAVSLCRIFENG